MGWERGESHVNSALLLSLPKLDVSSRGAEANKLDPSSLVQIQVSSACLSLRIYGNALASVSASGDVTKPGEVGSNGVQTDPPKVNPATPG